MSETLKQLLACPVSEMELEITEETREIARAVVKKSPTSKDSITILASILGGGIAAGVATAISGRKSDVLGNVIKGSLAGGVLSVLYKIADGCDIEMLTDELLGYLKPQNINNDLANALTKLPPGTPVYCDLAVLVEHTGITLPDGTIAQFNGNGNIENVSAYDFVRRLGGLNPSRIIRYPRAKDGKVLCSEDAAQRALEKLGTKREYNLITSNCHQFTYGCLSNDFENAKTLFWWFNNGIKDLFDQKFEWCLWDYFA